MISRNTVATFVLDDAVTDDVAVVDDDADVVGGLTRAPIRKTASFGAQTRRRRQNRSAGSDERRFWRGRQLRLDFRGNP